MDDLKNGIIKKGKKIIGGSKFFTLHSYFVTLPSSTAKLLRLGKKKNKFFCFALDFS